MKTDFSDLKSKFPLHLKIKYLHFIAKEDHLIYTTFNSY